VLCWNIIYFNALRHSPFDTLRRSSENSFKSRHGYFRVVTSDSARLPPALQPGFVVKPELKIPFPRAGFYKDGAYYAVNRCRGNLVNVRRRFLYMC
jgi:hypothetical protein